MKKKEIIKLLFNFDFDLKRLKIRISSKLSFFINNEFQMKFVFSIHCLFFFIVFFGNINIITHIFFIESTNNKSEMLKIFETRE